MISLHIEASISALVCHNRYLRQKLHHTSQEKTNLNFNSNDKNNLFKFPPVNVNVYNDSHNSSEARNVAQVYTPYVRRKYQLVSIQKTLIALSSTSGEVLETVKLSTTWGL
jgi:hypothetical protein